MTTFLTTTGLVFAAELGDKSQLLALSFATRFRWWVVLGAVLAATAVMQLLAVGAGQLVGTLLPDTFVRAAAGLAFLVFGLWMLGEAVGSDDEHHGDAVTHGARFGPFVMISATFLVAEIGDKTMLTAGALASDQQAFLPVWLGATLGMFVADAIAVAVGLAAGKHLPRRLIRIVAGLLFLGFAAWTFGGLFLR